MSIMFVAIGVAALVATDEGVWSDEDVARQHRELQHRKPRAEEDGEYLCSVYLRTAGSLIRKDELAARRLKMDVCTYAIGGIHPELQQRVAAVGRKADAKRVSWKISSGFRDNYRQTIASGFKARPGNSKHGNSPATKGYGFGLAVDFNGSAGSFFGLLREFGLFVPMRYDAGHVQMLNEPAKLARAETRALEERRAKRRARYDHSTNAARRKHRH